MLTGIGARDDFRPVAGMHGSILVAVENDRGQRLPSSRVDAARVSASRTVPPHCGKRRWEVASRSARQSRMHSHGRVEIGIGLSHCGCGRTAGR